MVFLSWHANRQQLFCIKCLYKSNCVLTCTDLYFILLTKMFEFFLLNYILLHCTGNFIPFKFFMNENCAILHVFLSIWPLKCSILVLTIYSLVFSYHSTKNKMILIRERESISKFNADFICKKHPKNTFDWDCTWTSWSRCIWLPLKMLTIRSHLLLCAKKTGT